jgi:HSP20 family molecular chaperone IbpA
MSREHWHGFESITTVTKNNYIMTDFFLNEFFQGTQTTLYKSEVKTVENGLEVHLLLPGFQKEEVEVSLEGEDLIIYAETERKLPRFLHNRVKRTYGVSGLNKDSLKARLEAGVLIISLEKAQEKSGRKITVQ